MSLLLNPAFAATFAPPVMEARRWLTETRLPEGYPLLNLSQAAPVDPPPAAMRAAMAAAGTSASARMAIGSILDFMSFLHVEVVVLGGDPSNCYML